MIRKYRKEDREKLLDLLRLNTPAYFAAAEAPDYLEYLDKYAQNYFVVENAGTIVGAGGINFGFDQGKTARLSWDIVHPDFQGKGVGKELVAYRIKEIRKHTNITQIVVRTSQQAYGFYQKSGFVLESTEKDFWAEGFDLYQMKLKLK